MFDDNISKRTVIFYKYLKFVSSSANYKYALIVYVRKFSSKKAINLNIL